jgi:acetyltransferase-like isoleucine patch superfamily enzyme
VRFLVLNWNSGLPPLRGVEMFSRLANLRKTIYELRMRRRHPGALIHSGATADPASTISRHAVLFAGVNLMESHIGAHTYIQARTRINRAVVGPFCSIASDVTIGLAAHPTHMVSSSPVFYDPTQPLPHFYSQEPVWQASVPPTQIEADVWIGEGARIKAGLTIGVGAVIGAGAIVTRDIPAYAIAVGVPARVVRHRFKPELRKRLEASRWWELDPSRLTQLAPHFSDPVGFLVALEDMLC